MATYVILNVEVTDEALHAQYRQRMGTLVASHGGRRLANTNETEVVAGDWAPDRLILVEFPGVEQAKGYVNALESDEFKELRARCVGSRNVVVIEGV